ncbi:hypothetical protein [Methylomonas sp. AM2-LC]|uniref:hypothetical protein n=1 Tax=Methylomonas sp. AM2-LC TaxID=3153301 RepID=UPI003266CCD4
MNQSFFEHTFGNGHCVHYRRLASGTCYHADTPETVVDILETVRQNQRKVRLFYGDVQTGQSWFEEHDVVGHIGRSTGSIKVPLLVPPGDIGGPALLDQCIIRIDSPKKVLYQHDTFQAGEFSLIGSDSKRLPWEVWINQNCHARFKDKTQARQYIEFLQGKRFELKH